MTLKPLTDEEKKRLLEALEVDREFRLAVAGLLGLREILEELRRLREDLNKFMAEQEKRWEENNRRWEENNKRWEENERRWEENNRRWEEAYKRFESIEKILLDHSMKIESLARAVRDLSKAVAEVRIAIRSLVRGMSRDLEKTVLEIYRDMIERFGIDVEKIEKISVRDEEGRYLHRDAKIELDIYISDKTTYLIEVKSLADEEDVRWFNYKADIVIRERRIANPRKMIIAINITREALELARQLNIETIYGSITE